MSRLTSKRHPDLLVRSALPISFFIILTTRRAATSTKTSHASPSAIRKATPSSIAIPLAKSIQRVRLAPDLGNRHGLTVDLADQGATGVVEMLFCTSLVALVGAADQQPVNSPRKLQIVNTKVGLG